MFVKKIVFQSKFDHNLCLFLVLTKISFHERIVDLILTFICTLPC